MGLLSDPEYGSVKWVRVLKKVHRPLCFLFYIGALVWFVLLGNREFNNETYFSENALLPGLVTNEFNGEQAAKQFLNEFQQELEDKYEDTDEMPVPWLVAKMSQLHLEVYTHNFTLNYPMGDGQVFKGTNVYGILRAARTPSLEALVVSAPYRSLSSHQKGTSAGIALMLAFAQFARPQKYWAKDIIFLITEHEQLGMQAWLEAYHGIQTNTETFYTSLGSFWQPGTSKLDTSAWFKSDANKCLNPGTLKGRSGSIQAAINLEFHTPKIKYIEVKVEGLNGQLPNLDLVNLVHKLCIKFRIHHSYKNSFSWLRTRDRMQEWKDGVLNMLGMLVTQLPGVPNGNHGLFHRYGIEAVTLEGREGSDPAGSPPRINSLTPNNFYRLGVALESILRSLNNLLERFHQSYFFYILAATDRFVSIGQYMPSLCLLCVAMLARALSLWVSIQKDEKPETPREQDNEGETERTAKEKETKDETVPKKKVQGRKESKGDVNINIMNIGTNYLLVHLIGYAVMNSPLLISQLGSIYYDYPSEHSVYIGFYLITIFLIFFTPTLPILLYSNRLTYEEVTLVNILLLIELATVCLSVGMHNYPLGLVLGVIYTPLALTVGIVEKKPGFKSAFLLLLKRVFAIALNPLIISAVSMMVYSFTLFPEEGYLGAFTRGSQAHMQAVMFSIVDSMIYGNWLFNIAASVILPIWILFWQILCINVETTEEIHEKNE